MNLQRLSAVAFASCIACNTWAAESPKTLDAYIDEAITVVRQNALHSKEVDWTAVSADAHSKARGAADILDTYPILVDILNSLGDGHSFVQVSKEKRDAYRARHGRDFDAAFAARKQPISKFKGSRNLETRMIDVGAGKAQMFNLRSFVGNPEATAAYAQNVYDAQAVAASWACGYVIDLRGNGGGNVWPMLAGLSPLLGDGRVYGANGRDGAYWADLKDGAATYTDAKTQQITARVWLYKALPQLSTMPVALLIDDATASSAEGVAIAFKGRGETRLFGAATYGVSTSNAGFELSDGANLVLTTGAMVDRSGRPYPSGVRPDEPLDPALGPHGEDAALAAAQTWLGLQKTCQAGSPPVATAGSH